MTQAKVELFDKELQDYAAFFKALSHPARLKIILFLAECKSCISGDISKELPLGRTTVNQHLKELKDLGLIKGEVDGVKVNYCLDFDKMKQMVGSCRRFIEGIDLENCC
jgi:DNA-binding transcriptional ArsR family regulator